MYSTKLSLWIMMFELFLTLLVHSPVLFLIYGLSLIFPLANNEHLSQIINGGSGCSDEGIVLSWRPIHSSLEISSPGTLFLTAVGKEYPTRIVLTGINYFLTFNFSFD